MGRVLGTVQCAEVFCLLQLLTAWVILPHAQHVTCPDHA